MSDNNNSDNKTVPYTRHVKVLAENAKLKDVATKLVRRIQGHWGVGDYFIDELKGLVKALDLPLSKSLENGDVGYYDRLDALNNISGGVIWDVENQVWIKHHITRGHV